MECVKLESTIKGWTLINWKSYVVALHAECSGKSAGIKTGGKKKAREASSRNSNIGKELGKWIQESKVCSISGLLNMKTEWKGCICLIFVNWEFISLYFYFSVVFSMYFRSTHFLLSCVCKKTFKFEPVYLLQGKKLSTWLQSLGGNISNLSRIFIGVINSNFFLIF